MMPPRPPSAIKSAFLLCAGYFAAAGAFSLVINLFGLAQPLYMMQVFDRVLSSGSLATLAMLTLAVFVSLVVLALIDDVRSRILIGWGIRIDSMLSAKVLEVEVERASLRIGGSQGQALRDLDQVRQVITGSGSLAFLDLIWTPVYLGICFMLHPLLGITALSGAGVLLLLAIGNQLFVTKPMAEAANHAQKSYRLTEGSLRNAEAVQAMGMLAGLMRNWRRERNAFMLSQATASRRSSGFMAAIRLLRVGLQIAITAVGAWLAVDQLITPGAMYACMLLAGRGVQPVDQVVGVWSQIVGAFAAAKRVDEVLAQPMREQQMQLPQPEGHLSVEGITFAAPNSEIAILRGVSFALAPGESLGVIGPTAAGKSTLARLLVGVWRPYSGVVRLDGADAFGWEREDFGRHVGYLPQDIELFAGSVRDNIARFQEPDPDAVVEAARRVGIHDMILRLPKGYDTDIGDGGAVLSGGQRQRIGLARAIYGNPKFVVLDEPNSNLDGQGEEALRQVLLHLKQQRATVVIIAHRPSMLVTVDKILVLRNGLVDRMGPTAAIMAQFAPNAAPLRVVQGGAQPAVQGGAPAKAIDSARQA
jgi:ATP-binding cassette subfamily C protein